MSNEFKMLQEVVLSSGRHVMVTPLTRGWRTREHSIGLLGHFLVLCLLRNETVQIERWWGSWGRQTLEGHRDGVKKLHSKVRVPSAWNNSYKVSACRGMVR